MAAYGALVSLFNSIDQIMNHPHLSTSLDQKQIQSLREKAALLLDFIEAYYYSGAVSKQSQELEKQIASAAHEAEDLIDSHIFDQILGSVDSHGETSSSSGVNLQKRTLKRVDAICKQANFSCSLYLQLIIQDMDTMLKEGAKVKEQLASKEEHPTHSRPLIRTGAELMVGFDDELIQLLDELTNQRTSRHIISIVGMGGAGKTTLAQNAYQNLLIKQHFDIRAWATVSHQHNVGEILSQLLSVQGKSPSRNDDKLGEKLYKSLSGRRYLIILDDVWSVEAWDEVRHFFPDNGSRSRVVLTTRLSNVARDCDSNSCLTMKPLDEHENWKLFCKKAFGTENCPHPELEGVGKEIARLCRGLPLSTVVIGGLLLNLPRSLQVWEKVVTNLKSHPDSKEKEKSLDILCLSYNHLPPYLKTCFLYVGLFMKYREIRVSTIISLWIAEGFVRANHTQILEEVAEGYLKELIDRNLILVSKRRGNGKIGCCGIHDLVRDLCVGVGKQQGFLPTKGRNIFARTTLEEPVNHKLLRVWDFKPSSHVYGNVNLRYLAHRPLFHLEPVWELPRLVSLIWNLQTLIITGFWPHSVVIAPIEIWKMRQLRHVKCDQIYVPDPDPPPKRRSLSVMDSLRTLATTMNLRVSKELCKRIPNIKKLYIAYGGHRQGPQGYDDSLIECLSNLDCLHKLESLKITLRRSKWPDLNGIVRFPISLNKLSVRGCRFQWEDVAMIGLLLHLQVLELGVDSVMDDHEWSPVEGHFLRLKVLKIDSCLLTYWNADSSHFPVLEKLILSYLPELEEIPIGIGEIATLELIRLEFCSESAAVSAVKIKEDQLENQGDDALQIQIWMNSSEVECLKERVETEGMTISNIQLETNSVSYGI